MFSEYPWIVSIFHNGYIVGTFFVLVTSAAVVSFLSGMFMERVHFEGPTWRDTVSNLAFVSTWGRIIIIGCGGVTTFSLPIVGFAYGYEINLPAALTHCLAGALLGMLLTIAYALYIMVGGAIGLGFNSLWGHYKFWRLKEARQKAQYLRVVK